MNNLHIIASNYRVRHCKSVPTVQPLDCAGWTKRTDEDSQISGRTPAKQKMEKCFVRNALDEAIVTALGVENEVVDTARYSLASEPAITAQRFSSS